MFGGGTPGSGAPGGGPLGGGAPGGGGILGGGIPGDISIRGRGSIDGLETSLSAEAGGRLSCISGGGLPNS